MKSLPNILNLFKKTLDISSLDIELGTKSAIVRDKASSLLIKQNIRLEAISEALSKNASGSSVLQSEENKMLADIDYIYMLLAREFTDSMIGASTSTINLQSENYLGFEKSALLFTLHNIGYGNQHTTEATEAFKVLEEAKNSIPKGDLKTLIYLMCCTRALNFDKITAVIALIIFLGGEFNE